MSAHYLFYWTLKRVEYHYFGGVLDHLSGNTLQAVNVGDVLWVVTACGGDLLLVGRLQVGERIDAAEDGRFLDPFSLRQARWHLLAADHSAQALQWINLTEQHITFSLRFSSTADRLRLNRHGRLNTVSLYRPRRLTDDSAALLAYLWHSEDGQSSPELAEPTEAPLLYAEGRANVRVRQVRQRSQALTYQVKRRSLETDGDLRCGVCGMSFGQVYGELGAGYIEAHHPEPISHFAGEQFTDADDIVLLCANCHRMVHRRNPPYSIQELRDAVTAQRHYTDKDNHP
ncbi:MAG: HNH endonuclease [Phototrophicaceae bacterium]